jgi:hypothetical protein
MSKSGDCDCGRPSGQHRLMSCGVPYPLARTMPPYRGPEAPGDEEGFRVWQATIAQFDQPWFWSQVAQAALAVEVQRLGTAAEEAGRERDAARAWARRLRAQVESPWAKLCEEFDALDLEWSREGA